MKKSFLITIAFISTMHHSALKSGTKLALFSAGVGATSLYFLYKKFRTPGEFVPTIENTHAITVRPAPLGIQVHPEELHTLVRKIKKNKLPETSYMTINDAPYAVHKGIALKDDDNLVYIFVRGYAKKDGPSIQVKKQFYDLLKIGGGLQGAYVQCHDKIIPPSYPIISFDLPDDQKNFAFGGPKEVKTLQCVYDEICAKNASAQIVVIGDCRGGKVTLDWLTGRPQRVKAVVLMCPFISGKELSDTLADNHLAQWFPFSKLTAEQRHSFLHSWFFQSYYPSYNQKDDNLYDRLANIDTQLPILLAHREKDALVGQEVIDKISQTLMHDSKHTLRIIATSDRSYAHSKLTHLPDIKRAIHHFFKEWDLPYDLNLCEEPKTCQNSLVQ